METTPSYASAIQWLRKNPWTTTSVVLLSYIYLVLLLLIVRFSLLTYISFANLSRDPIEMWQSLRIVPKLIIVASYGICFWTTAATGLAGVAALVCAERDSSRVSLRPAVWAQFTAFPKLLTVGCVAGPMVVSGSLLVVPGLFLAVLFSFVAPVIVVEGAGPLAAAVQSVRATRGRRWRLMAIFAFTGLILGGLELITTPAVFAFGIPAVIPALIILALIGSVVNVWLTLMYFDQHQRKLASAAASSG